MAALTKVPGISVTLSSGGVDLNEYEDHDELVEGGLTEKTVVKYVEAISAAEYMVKIDITPQYKPDCYQLLLYVYVDGKNITSRVCAFGDSWNGQSFRVLGAEDIDEYGVVTLRNLKFSSITLGENGSLHSRYSTDLCFLVEDTDSSQVKKDIKAIVDVGEVCVKIYRANYGVIIANRATVHIGQAITDISEKALKGKDVSHSTS